MSLGVIVADLPEAALLTNEKATLALIDSLRFITPPDAKVATPKSAAEALLLRITVYQGRAARLANRIVVPIGTMAAGGRDQTRPIAIAVQELAGFQTDPKKADVQRLLLAPLFQTLIDRHSSDRLSGSLS